LIGAPSSVSSAIQVPTPFSKPPHIGGGVNRPSPPLTQ
jgi:hypothetical protein